MSRKTDHPRSNRPEACSASPRVGFLTILFPDNVFAAATTSETHWWKKNILDSPGRMVEPEEGFIDHPTPKPTKFIRELVGMFTKEGDIILDPFMGSGSTGVACQDLDRIFIGFEINKKYYELSKKRLGLRKKKISDFNSS